VYEAPPNETATDAANADADVDDAGGADQSQTRAIR